MELQSGHILVAHPKFYFKDFKRSVIVLTDVGSVTTGLELNKRTGRSMQEVLDKQGYVWPYHNEVHFGGYANQNVLYCLHDNMWFSKSTQLVGEHHAISSDDFMIDKFCSLNTPEFFKMFFGCLAWGPGQLTKQICNNHWITISANTNSLIESDVDDLYDFAIQTYSQKGVESFF